MGSIASTKEGSHSKPATTVTQESNDEIEFDKTCATRHSHAYVMSNKHGSITCTRLGAIEDGNDMFPPLQRTRDITSNEASVVTCY